MAHKIDVVIPSATLVPQELQNIGKLPGIIYPVNHRIVFDYLYEQYKNIDGTIDVICFESKEKIRSRLSSYKDEKIQIKDLHILNDLGHTLHFALTDKTAPVLINFADTIIMDDVLNMHGDVIFYAEDYMSHIWTFFEIEQGVITKIHDKVEGTSQERNKLFVGLFMISDSRLFSQCLEEAFDVQNSDTSTFYNALRRYSLKKPFQTFKVENWFDIGHFDTYQTSKIAVQAREFNYISIDKERGILRKSSDDKEKFIGEIFWYLKLPSDIEYVRPRIFSYSTDYSNPYVSMEYYAYHTVHELFLYGDLSYQQWFDIFKRIKFIVSDFSRYSVKDNKMQAALQEVYLDKTLARFEKMQENSSLKKYFDAPIKVNGITYCSLSDISMILCKSIPELLYDVDTFQIIHGDLCFSNIMVDSNVSVIKLIDPRGKFGSFDIYGDMRYELAKLLHSIDGKYDFIIKDLFEIEYQPTTNEITYSISDRNRPFDIYQLVLHVFKEEIGENLRKIELIESLLFLSMIPLHGESLNHQIAMLATGLEILNRVIDITV